MGNNDLSEKNKKDNKAGRPDGEQENIILAHEQADLDIEKDPDLNTEPEKGDDLDEGELAQLEGEDA